MGTYVIIIPVSRETAWPKSLENYYSENYLSSDTSYGFTHFHSF